MKANAWFICGAKKERQSTDQNGNSGSEASHTHNTPAELLVVLAFMRAGA